MSWLANTDVSPCTSKQAVLEHAAKYAAERGKKSPAFRDIAANLNPFVNENLSCQPFVTEVMNKLISDRNYPAQEVCHLLLDLPLTGCSRTIINVDLRSEDQQPDLYHIEGDETRRGLSLLMKHRDRSQNPDDDLINVTYIRFLKSHAHTRPYAHRPRANERVLNIFPRYKADDVENYGRAKLMLHHPFFELTDLLYIEDLHDELCDSFTIAYEAYRAMCDHSQDPDGLGEPVIEPEESLHESTPGDVFDDGQNTDAEWGEIAAQLPNRAGENIDIQDCLGNRLMDL
jgi:hypothetical protein